MLSLLGAAMLTSAGEAPEPIVLDLFLVARNEWRIEGFELLEKKEKAPGALGVLKARLQALEAQKKSYLILDGGECPLFLKKDDDWKISHTERNIEEYDAFTEVSVVRGVERKKVLSRGLSVGGGWGGINVRTPVEKLWYASQLYCYPFGFDKTKPSVCFRDLNAYRMALTTDQEQDRAGVDRTLVFSPLPIAQSRQYFTDYKLDFDGVCISATGLPQKDAPNFIAFPPAGVVAHYALTRESNRWTVRLVDYLTAANGEGRTRL